MKTRTLLFFAAGLALLHPAPVRAQQTIRAGMSEEEVRSRLGTPAQVRESDGWTYLFYLNGCAVRCGSDDVVFLRDGRVVTAVFRTRRRRFAGTDASGALEGTGGGMAGRAPGAPRPAPVERSAAPARVEEPARVEGIRVTVPGSEDVSIGRPRGVIIIRDALGTERIQSDTALDRTRQERERNVTERTIRPQGRETPVADTLLDQTRRERERSVEPRTVRPQPRTPR